MKKIAATAAVVIAMSAAPTIAQDAQPAYENRYELVDEDLCLLRQYVGDEDEPRNIVRIHRDDDLWDECLEAVGGVVPRADAAAMQRVDGIVIGATIGTAVAILAATGDGEERADRPVSR